MKKILGWTLMAPEDGDGGAGADQGYAAISTSSNAHRGFARQAAPRHISTAPAGRVPSGNVPALQHTCATTPR